MALQADNKASVLAILTILSGDSFGRQKMRQMARQLCDDSERAAVERVCGHVYEADTGEGAALTALIADVTDNG